MDMNVSASLGSSFENYLTGLVHGISEEGKEETDEEKISKIRDVFLTHSPLLIRELQANPSLRESYRWMEASLYQIGTNLKHEVYPFIYSIQKIADILRSSNKDLNEYFQLNLPENIELVRSIPDPELKYYVMATLLNKINLNPDIIELQRARSFELLTKEEFILMGPHLTHLKLSYGMKAQDIHDILDACPNIQQLVIESEDFESIPFRPSYALIHLTCPALKHLPPVLYAQFLYFHRCSALVALSQLPNCKKLDLFHCHKLIEIPPLPNGEIVSCYHGIELRSMLGLPRLERLSIYNCPNFRQVPEAPSLRRIQYSDCPSLDLRSIPQQFLRGEDRMRLQRNVYGQHRPQAEQAAQFARSLVIDMSELIQDPCKILLELGKALLLGKKFPFIKFKEINGQSSPSIDSGAGKKILITKLIASLVSNAEKKEQMSFVKDINAKFVKPILEAVENVEDQKRGFQALGTLLGYCLLKGYLIDRIFDPALFEAIASFSGEELNAIPEKPIKLTNEMHFKVLSILFPHDKIISILQIPSKKWDVKDLETLQSLIKYYHNEPEEKEVDQKRYEDQEWVYQEAMRLYIQERKKSDFVLPVVLIAKHMHMILNATNKWDKYCGSGGFALQKIFEGSLNSKAIIKARVWDESKVMQVPEAQRKIITGWFEKWIKESKEEALRNFVYTVTGFFSLSPETELKFEFHDRKNDEYTRAHVCFNAIEIPVCFQSYEALKDSLELLIVQSVDPKLSGLDAP